MKITDKHSDYTSNFPVWERCRDVVSGQDAIHEAGEKYLPRLDGQSDSQYDSYKNRTRFLNASDRTVRGMNGIVFRKSLAVAPDGEDFEKDVSHQGISLEEYASEVLNELLTVGRCGTLVDHPASDAVKTVAQAEAKNETPLWAFYIAENIYDWSFSFVDNKYQLVRVVLFDGIDNSSGENVYHYRELILKDGVYSQNIYTGSGNDDKPTFLEAITPRMNGKTISFIPFIIHGVGKREHIVDKPPLLDLFDTNIKHYQLKADHMHGLHYIALPTPYVIGISAEEAPDSIGPQRVWSIPNELASVGILEFSGAGMEAIASELTSIETNMAQLGSRMLAPEVTQAETATATTIKSMSENSTLSSISKGEGKQLSRAWNWSLMWIGTPSDGSIELNDDFMSKLLSGSDLLAIVSSWQSGAFSKETMFKNLQHGEIISDATTFDDEELKIDTEAMNELDFNGNKDG